MAHHIMCVMCVSNSSKTIFTSLKKILTFKSILYYLCTYQMCYVNIHRSYVFKPMEYTVYDICMQLFNQRPWHGYTRRCDDKI